MSYLVLRRRGGEGGGDMGTGWRGREGREGVAHGEGGMRGEGGLEVDGGEGGDSTWGCVGEGGERG